MKQGTRATIEALETRKRRHTCQYTKVSVRRSSRVVVLSAHAQAAVWTIAVRDLMHDLLTSTQNCLRVDGRMSECRTR